MDIEFYPKKCYNLSIKDILIVLSNLARK